MKRKAYNILVVDDEIDLHYLFKKHFRDLIKQGSLVFEFASNGKEALDLIKSDKIFHLLFTDIRMPVMDGLTLLNHLKEMKSEIKTVVISAYDDISNIRTAMNRDAFDFLVKPIALDDLTLTLEKTIREYEVYIQGIESAKNLVLAIQEKEEAVHKERQRLSRDLHDDIGSTLSSINIISKMALKNEVLQNDEQLKSSVEKISERSQRLLDNMSDIVWCINPNNDTLEEILSRMRSYATTILEAKKIDYQIDFPKKNIDFKMRLDFKNNMYLIFKEAVNNLSKYSGCTNAYLSLNFDEKNIYLKIEDNGNGFNKEEVKHQGGLHNMYYRSEEINALFSIQSIIGNGTVVELTIPQ
jgi:signal transduction histidine kinase